VDLQKEAFLCSANCCDQPGSQHDLENWCRPSSVQRVQRHRAMGATVQSH
jgi:hypothetical protein